MRRLLLGFAAVASLLSFTYAEGETKIHEAGRCAIRGHCGKQGFFGGNLPCPDNGLAKEPTDDVRKKLVALCGDKWSEGPVCCEDEQIDTLSSNLKLANSIMSSCPACKTNFYNLFCTFSCSPDQSLFVNITKTETASSGKDIVTELQNVWSKEYQSGFYDSCKDVKNGITGGLAMDFIGGGAKNYSQFLKFLGDKKPLGSPFQMNFMTKPNASDYDGMDPLPEKPKACNDTDQAYRCSCIDCAPACPELPKVTQEDYCHVGVLPCMSFAVILVYCVFLLLVVIAISGHIAYAKQQQRKSERLQLLQDATLSDDEDEGDLVHHAGLLDRPQRNYRLNSIFDYAFSKLGGICARFPALTISISVLVIGLLSVGWINFAIEKDPVRLWVSPESAAAEEKAFFDANFGPFYRAEQAFLVNDTLPSGPGPVLNYDTLAWWFDVESRVHRLRSLKYELSLDDICFKPTGEGCVIQSLSGWFGGSFSGVDRNSWQDRLLDCSDSPGRIDCLPEFQQPIQPGMVLGGYNKSETVLDAKALVVTWVVNNHPEGSEGEDQAKDWEDSYKSLFDAVQDEAKDRGLRVSFNTEISLEEELNKTTNTDAKIVVISYVVMFIYASLALGSATLTSKTLFNNPANALVQSKFTLGVVGILIVLMSVAASIGLFSATGIKVTLIIAEVIPFLVLAIGVDNIFLIVSEFEKVNISHPDEEIDERMAKALGRMGPSILFSATTETVAFAMGCFVGMPAVKNFAAYAAGAVVINALLQVTMFVSVLALNQRRVENQRADCFPCLTIKKASSAGIPGGQLYEGDEDGLLQKFIQKTYATSLLGKKVKISIIVGFLGLFAAGLALIPEVALGLDQRNAIPSDSYLIDYFSDLYAYFGQGPPVYFVTRNLNVTQRSHQQELCGRFYTCDDLSMSFLLEQESKRPEVSHISGSAASWIDDFFFWLNPDNEGCCVENGKTCFDGRDPPWNLTLSGMPEGQEFIYYLQKWIDSPTDSDCPLGGKAPYSTALVIDSEGVNTPATHFRTSHTPLRSQEDFINSYASARRIAKFISEENDIDVFPYSKFYIFFDQYASIIRLTGTLLGSAIAIIFLISAILLGSIATAAVVTITVVMIVVDIIGTMAVAKVSLNALSLVNLVICVGIGVEFCAHIARAFMFPSKSVLEKAKSKFRGKDARAWTALVNVGGSVFTGITVTKLLGVFVLAFTRSKIFEIYYFRIWLALVIFASTHALIFLPVALSLFGGEGYVDPDSDGGLEEDLASRRYRALIPDSEYDSEED